jgi:hypothetical protein
VVPIIFIITYLISLSMWKLNRKWHSVYAYIYILFTKVNIYYKIKVYKEAMIWDF